MAQSNKTSLQNHLQRLRDVRSATLRRVHSLSQAQLDFQPQPGAWSIGELLDHLIKGDALYGSIIAELIMLVNAGQTPYIYWSFAKLDASPSFIPISWLPWVEPPFLLWTTWTPQCLQESIARADLIPNRHPSITTPQRGRSKTELYPAIQVSLEQQIDILFNTNSDLDYNNMVFQHPFLGRRNIPSLLNLMTLHDEVHQGQILNIVNHPQFPIE